jgi:polar amino acid transport system substrate-binding protein
LAIETHASIATVYYLRMALEGNNSPIPSGVMRLVLALALWVVVAGAYSTEPGELTYLTEDYPPENFVRDGAVRGYSVDILKAVWRKLGVAEQPIEVLPWARGYWMVQNKPRTMLFAMARTPEREKLFHWVGPFYQATIALVTPTGRTVEAHSLTEARRLHIATIRNDIGEQFLKDKGFPDSSIYLVNSLEQGLKMLDAGRVALICANPGSLPPGYHALWPVGEVKDYYALSLDVDRSLVTRFQRALDSLGEERKGILRRYGAVE